MSEEKKYSRRAFGKVAGGWVAAAAVAKACVPNSPQPDGAGGDGSLTDGRLESLGDGGAKETRREDTRAEGQGREQVSEPTKEQASDRREPAAETPPQPDDSIPEARPEPTPEPQPEPRPEPTAPDVKPPDLNGRKYVTVDLNKHPDMKKIGWYIEVTLPSDSVNLFRRSASTFAAISMTCTHNGCFVWWRSQSNFFQCPCHAATFDSEGHVTGGPAPRDLRVYPTGYDSKANIAYIFLDR